MVRAGATLVTLGVLVATGAAAIRSSEEPTAIPSETDRPLLQGAADGGGRLSSPVSRLPNASATHDARRSGQGGGELIDELGCAVCHAGLNDSPDLIRSRAPSLAFAGLRYQTAYVFAFLRSPTRVRRHIGSSRMPDFHLDERESLALALYLETLAETPAVMPPYPRQLLDGRTPRASRRNAERLVREELGCLACHSLNGTGGMQAVELAGIGARLGERWVRQYLAAPHAFDSATTMPSAFFAWEGGDAPLAERVDDPVRKLWVVTGYLFSLDRSTRRERERALERAKDHHPQVGATVGERIFRALNCAGCHSLPSQRGTLVGPDLSRVGRRVRAAWLQTYLARPVAVRPVGFLPGTGSRMPDFQLSGDEASAIADYLETRTGPELPAFAPQSLSPFARAKAEGYLRDRLPCLGCHRLNGEGGRIGPDLSNAGARLEPSYIRAMIHDPAGTNPGTAMPQMPMPLDRVELLASYLAARTSDSGLVGYLSLVDYESMSPVLHVTTGEGLYTRYCAACHGVAGNADGYNAAFLPVAPTRHADSAAMSRRPDDTLFDGIHAGGYILGRSHRMPAFGQMLSTPQIRSLVAHIRRLCRCEQPSWAR